MDHLQDQYAAEDISTSHFPVLLMPVPKAVGVLLAAIPAATGGMLWPCSVPGACIGLAQVPWAFVVSNDCIWTHVCGSKGGVLPWWVFSRFSVDKALRHVG